MFVNQPLMIAVFAITALSWSGASAPRAADAPAPGDQLADFKRALDAAAIVAITDVKGRITYVNDKFVEISGYSREELIGQDHRIINSATIRRVHRTLWRTIARGRSGTGSCATAPAGAPLLGRHTIVPFVNEAGKPYQYIAIRADITARKRRRRLSRSRRHSRGLGRWRRSLAHEVRNPLAGIRGAMEILMGRAIDDPSGP